MRRRFNSSANPREMTARRDGTCSCGKPIRAGDTIRAINGKGWRCAACTEAEWHGYLAEESYSRYGNDLAFER